MSVREKDTGTKTKTKYSAAAAAAPDVYTGYLNLDIRHPAGHYI